MAFDFEVVEWEDGNGERHSGKPSDLSDTYGVKVFAYDDETGETHTFWRFIPSPYDSWTQWLDHIGINMEEHGMALA